ncbi:hypothetical protein CYMTET_37205 [Cymbomonas tetramitiformis]|uniref:Uncharacterized protein n=1 Tax=Cymbomonas tetramitiformis TaxID=36881 RepID=A0AAE0CG73_9CHLO|nr:hypothetical protein CYMTET_37205 [Cymbomonas tetramitiformis]
MMHCRNHAHDQYGLPTCCMTHPRDPKNWQPPGGVVDLVTDDDSSNDNSDTEDDDECQPERPLEDADDGDKPRSPTPPHHQPLHPLHHHSYMARSMVNHRHIPASFRRVDSAAPPPPAAPVAVRGRGEDNRDPPTAATAMALMKTSDWVEEDHDAHPQSLSAAMSTTTANHLQVPLAELQRLTSKAFEEMSPDMTDWFRRTAVCYTLCNEDPKKSILVMSQRTGQYLTLFVMIVDTGSMPFVMNKVHQETLGLKVHSSTATVDTSMGSGGAQQHRQWGAGELMLVVATGTSNEMVLADVAGISPSSPVSFDVLLSVDILHAMSAGVLPATPGRGAALAYHPRNQQGDFEHKAYLPLKVFKHHGSTQPPATQFGGGAAWTAHLYNMMETHDSASARKQPTVATQRSPCRPPSPADPGVPPRVHPRSLLHHPGPRQRLGGRPNGAPRANTATLLMAAIGVCIAAAASAGAVIKGLRHTHGSPFRAVAGLPLSLETLAPWHKGTDEKVCQFCNQGSCRGVTSAHACHLSGQTGLYARWTRQSKIPANLRPLLMLVVNTSRVDACQAPLTRADFRQQYGQPNPINETHKAPCTTPANAPPLHQPPLWMIVSMIALTMTVVAAAGSAAAARFPSFPTYYLTLSTATAVITTPAVVALLTRMAPTLRTTNADSKAICTP